MAPPRSERRRMSAISWSTRRCRPWSGVLKTRASGRGLMIEVPAVGPLDAVLERYLCAPAEKMQSLHVVDLRRRAVCLGVVEVDRAREADQPADQHGEISDGDPFAAAEVDDRRIRIVLH